MQGNRVKAMTAFIVLLGLIGCKDRSTHTIAIDKPNDSYEVHEGGFRRDTDITWTYTKSFYIEFSGSNPCTNQANSGMRYNATGSGTTFTVTCTVKHPLTGGPFPYNIGPPPPPTPPPSGPPGHPIVTTSSGHCEGCVIDND
jgi:hypothetical protein